MPAKTDNMRLLSILLGRHRKIGNLLYKNLLVELESGKSGYVYAPFYRGFVSDIISILKELREQEAHRHSLEFSEMFEDIYAQNGADVREKIQNWVKNEKQITF
jgi:hypothetical protein